MTKGKFKGFFALLGCLFIILVFLGGCTDNSTYRGEYQDLYTEAIHSILWNAGYSSYHHNTAQPEIKILEKDDYGRTLYTYFENWNAEYNLVISQYSDDDYVYYYEDCNFLTKEITNPLTEFSKVEADYLKSLNDWGKEINPEKCVKKPITNVKPSIPCDEKIIEEKVALQFKADEKRSWTGLSYLTSDSVGNFIVYGYINLYDDDKLIQFAIIIDADCEEFKFFVPSELYNYQEELKNFKAENGWMSK